MPTYTVPEGVYQKLLTMMKSFTVAGSVPLVKFIDSYPANSDIASGLNTPAILVGDSVFDDISASRPKNNMLTYIYRPVIYIYSSASDTYNAFTVCDAIYKKLWENYNLGATAGVRLLRSVNIDKGELNQVTDTHQTGINGDLKIWKLTLEVECEI